MALSIGWLLTVPNRRDGFVCPPPHGKNGHPRLDEWAPECLPKKSVGVSYKNGCAASPRGPSTLGHWPLHLRPATTLGFRRNLTTTLTGQAGRMKSRDTRNAFPFRSRGGFSRRRPPNPAAIVGALVAAGLVALWPRLEALLPPSTVDQVSQSAPYSLTFGECGSASQAACVVDGDTFWLDGMKVRIADIDTPELSPPRCDHERDLGLKAKARLRELLSAGPFTLVRGTRDEDRYGRKLRVVRAEGGTSLGAILIQEGLARLWDGSRHPWCS